MGLGLRYVNEKGSDLSKLREYQDLGSDAITTFDLRGTSDTHRFNFFVENITTDDTYFTVLGQQYGAWRLRLYGNELRHRFGSGPGALSPYAGIGTDTLTATLPNIDVGTWKRFRQFAAPPRLRGDGQVVGFHAVVSAGRCELRGS